MQPPYFREEELGGRLGQILKDIHIPDQALLQIIEALHANQRGIQLSNCTIDAVSLYPTYRKAFYTIFTKGKTQEWCTPTDSRIAAHTARL
jgi:hypothetical protein